MEKRTAFIAAGAIALTVAGASSALALTLSAAEPGSGTGDVGTYRVSSTVTDTPVTGMTVYVDENGNVVPAPTGTAPGSTPAALATAGTVPSGSVPSGSVPVTAPSRSQVSVPSSTPVTVDDHGGERDRDDRVEHGDDRDDHDERDEHDDDRKHDNDDD